MGVYIKGMEMPRSCYACMFFAQTDYWNKEDEADILSHCKRTGEKTWESVNGYLPNCPIATVPKHGKLIEKNDVFELIRSFPNVDRQLPVEFMKALYELPTILEEEEGE